MTSRREFLAAGAGLGLAAARHTPARDEGQTAFRRGGRLYANPLAAERDVRGFRLEGDADVSFPDGRMRLASVRDPTEGQAANFVYWCPEDLPRDVEIAWEFLPLNEPGLSMLFFAARGRNGEDLFDRRLKLRSGPYTQYHHGDINAFHASYFRRSLPEERAFHTCNLRKSHGFHLVAQGADPIPSVADAKGPYRLRLATFKGSVEFSINELPIFQWKDDGLKYGPVLGGGKIGFRQMAPLIAEYANLTVHALEPELK
jgi:hypothetical protein